MQNEGVRIGYISATIGNPEDDLHLTLARCYDATEQELINMQHMTEEPLRSMLPLMISWGNYCTMGEKGTFPAYRVYFVHQKEPMRKLYSMFYKEAPGKALWPRATYHVTCDTPAKRAALETLIRASPNNQYRVCNVSFKTRVEEAGAETWSCAVCGLCNKIQNKLCDACECDRWAPHARAGDWSCCGVNNFASRSTCMKCNRPREASAPTAPPEYEVAPLKRQAQGGGKRPDWHCYKCDFIVFGSKDACGKCGSKNPN